MIENIILFLKGLIIGIGKIIPGVSGSMIAITFGVYEKLIDSIANIFKFNKNNVQFLLIIGSGIIVSIVFFSKVIIYSLNTYYLSTMLLFIGMIIGCVPSIFKDTKKCISVKNIILLSIPFLILVILNLTSNMEFKIKISFVNLIILGIIEAVSMIIPGISGSAILMTLGIYETVIDSFTTLNKLNILIPFLIGISIGIFTLSNIINKIIKKDIIGCYYVVLGFTVSTILLLLGNIFKVSYTISEILVGIIFMFIGFVISYKLN